MTWYGFTPLHSEAGDTCSEKENNGTFERKMLILMFGRVEDPFEENEEAVILRVLKR